MMVASKYCRTAFYFFDTNTKHSTQKGHNSGLFACSTTPIEHHVWDVRFGGLHKDNCTLQANNFAKRYLTSFARRSLSSL